MLRLYEMSFHPSIPTITVLSTSGTNLSNVSVPSATEKGKTTGVIQIKPHEFCLKEMPLNT